MAKKQRIISRVCASRQGLKTFFTGEKCPYGHLTKRRVINGQCAKCANIASRIWRKNNPEKSDASTNNWRRNNLKYYQSYSRENAKRWYRENRKRAIANVRKRYLRLFKESPEKLSIEATLRAAKWRRENPAKADAIKKRWRKNNPEKSRNYNHQRRVKLLGSTGSHTEEDIRQLFFKQRGKCKWCKCKIFNKYHVDHKTPLSRGGSDFPRNLQLLCKKCNQSKSAKTMREWISYLKKVDRFKLRKVKQCP